VLAVTRKNFALSFNIFHKFDNCFTILVEVQPSRSALEMVSVELKEVVIDISASNVPAVVLLKYIHLSISESTSKDAEL
jgi:hypothetical protein